MFNPEDIDKYAKESAKYIISIQKSAFIAPSEYQPRIENTIKQAFLAGKEAVYREQLLQVTKKALDDSGIVKVGGEQPI